MDWIIPGTTLEGRRDEADGIDKQFRAMCLAGGLSLGQVAGITGLENYTIQNWVKRGFLSPPRNKRYDLEQLCRIITINMLKGSLSLEQICSLMSHVNGNLTDDSDDLIDDGVLYFMFVRLAARARYLGGSKTWDEALEEVTASYKEPVPGARDRVIRVLKIMLTVWVSNRLRLEAEQQLKELT